VCILPFIYCFICAVVFSNGWKRAFLVKWYYVASFVAHGSNSEWTVLKRILVVWLNTVRVKPPLFLSIVNTLPYSHCRKMFCARSGFCTCAPRSTAHFGASFRLHLQLLYVSDVAPMSSCHVQNTTEYRTTCRQDSIGLGIILTSSHRRPVSQHSYKRMLFS